MRSAAKFALLIALAASGAAAAQGVGLRVGTAGAGGDVAWWIAPTLGARIGYIGLDLGATGLGYDGGGRHSSLSGMVEPANGIAPYLGIGYGSVARAGVSFYFDLGVVYQGSPRASLAGNCGTSVSAAQCARFQSDAAAGRSSLERSLDKYDLYPVGQIGVSVGF